MQARSTQAPRISSSVLLDLLPCAMAWNSYCWYHQLGTVYTVKWTVCDDDDDDDDEFIRPM
jgi:hypothetical protein